LLGGHCLLATLAGAVILLKRDPQKPLDSGGPWLIGLMLASLGALELFVIGPLGISLFSWIHFTYLDFALVLPILTVLALALARTRTATGSRRGMTLAARLFAVIGFATIPVVGYATFIEPFDLRLEEATVQLPEVRTGPAPLRIAVLSDLQARHVTDYERDAVTRLLATKPDIILVPGDVIHLTNFEAYDAALPEFHKLLTRLEAPGGVYFVQGNTDPNQRLEQLVEGTHMQLLRDRIVRFEYAGRRIAIGGLDLDHHAAQRGLDVIAQLEDNSDPAEVRLLVAHRPDALWSLSKNSRIDLVVSGHTHGGQIQIPFFGPPVTLSSVPRRVAAGGLHEVDGRRIYVSRGVGLERGTAPRVRLFAPPEISLITIE